MRQAMRMHKAAIGRTALLMLPGWRFVALVQVRNAAMPQRNEMVQRKCDASGVIDDDRNLPVHTGTACDRDHMAVRLDDARHILLRCRALEGVADQDNAV